MPQKKKRIFISFSKQDAMVAQKICNELEREGIDCWIFTRDIAPGKNFPEVIVDAINQCQLLLLVFSENTNNSQHVIREINLAVSREIPIFSIRIENRVLGKALDYFISISQWLDAYEQPFETYLPGIILAVTNLVGINETEGSNIDVSTPPAMSAPPTHPKGTQEKISFRNSFEDNVEYIRITGGMFRYSLSKKMETVTDLYFCKYPVTNKRYNRFLSYLEGNEKELETTFSLKKYREKLRKFADSIVEFQKFLAKNSQAWQELFRSNVNDKEFRGDQQPRVWVSWFSARAYCFWLSCLDEVRCGNNQLEDIKKLANIYRLPTEIEWEWVAGGEPDGSIRKYPWPNNKGGPDPRLANYGGNVGATTSVDSYPEGATPQGLMDIAGNVWEWMENIKAEKSQYRALRGGSWGNDPSSLSCFSRNYFLPDYRNSYVGFRVVRCQL